MWFPKEGDEYYYPSCPATRNIRADGYADHYWATLAILGMIVRTQEDAQRLWNEANEKARKELTPEPWRPTEPGQEYIYVSTGGGSRFTYFLDHYEPGDVDDEMRIAIGNCFETIGECCEYIDAERKLREEIRMKQAKRKVEVRF